MPPPDRPLLADGFLPQRALDDGTRFAPDSFALLPDANRPRPPARGPRPGQGSSTPSRLLLYTGSSDAEGTLGGLVQQARHVDEHLAHAFRTAALCSNDPICAHHAPGESIEGRCLHGAACHGCTLIAETSCEMRNDYLDRALVVPVLGYRDAAFFRPAS